MLQRMVCALVMLGMVAASAQVATLSILPSNAQVGPGDSLVLSIVRGERLYG